MNPEQTQILFFVPSPPTVSSGQVYRQICVCSTNQQTHTHTTRVLHAVWCRVMMRLLTVCDTDTQPRRVGIFTNWLVALFHTITQSSSPTRRTLDAARSRFTGFVCVDSHFATPRIISAHTSAACRLPTDRNPKADMRTRAHRIIWGNYNSVRRCSRLSVVRSCMLICMCVCFHGSPGRGAGGWRRRRRDVMLDARTCDAIRCGSITIELMVFARVTRRRRSG